LKTGSQMEIEIKLRLTSAAEGRRRLRKAGFRITGRRVFEQNVIFDTPRLTLRRRGLLLRLRTTTGRASLVTFKGPAQRGKHKARKEIEFEIGDAGAFAQVVDALGYRPSFRYEKFRTEFRETGVRPAGLALLDETPVGTFLELEGSPRWIDGTARALGFSETEYITATYAELHRAARSGRRDMVF